MYIVTVFRPSGVKKTRLRTTPLYTEIGQETSAGWVVLAKYVYYSDSFLPESEFYRTLRKDMEELYKENKRDKLLFSLLCFLKDIF